MEHIWFHSGSIRQVQLTLIKEVWQSSCGTELSKLVGLCTSTLRRWNYDRYRLAYIVCTWGKAQNSGWKHSLSFYFKRIMISIIIISYKDICILGCSSAHVNKIIISQKNLCFKDIHTPRPLNSHNPPDYETFVCSANYCPASRTTLVATRFRVAVICPIIQVPHCIRVFFYFVWFVFINHIFQFYYELCTYCNILDIYLS